MLVVKKTNTHIKSKSAREKNDNDDDNLCIVNLNRRE